MSEQEDIINKLRNLPKGKYLIFSGNYIFKHFVDIKTLLSHIPDKIIEWVDDTRTGTIQFTCLKDMSPVTSDDDCNDNPLTSESNNCSTFEVPTDLPDSRNDQRGQGLRYNSGKDPMEFVPLHLVTGAAKVFKHVTERASKPYPKWNWARGMEWSKPYACMLRHLTAWYCGEDNDPETGLNHLYHVHCNLLMLIHYLDAYQEGDDRPTKYFQKGGMESE